MLRISRLNLNCICKGTDTAATGSELRSLTAAAHARQTEVLALLARTAFSVYAPPGRTAEFPLPFEV